MRYLVILVFVLSACSTQTNDTPLPEIDNFGVSGNVNRSAYLETIRAKEPGLNEVSDSLLVRYGKSICRLFDTGASFPDAVRNATDAGLPSDVASTIIGASVGAFCPEHTDKF